MDGWKIFGIVAGAVLLVVLNTFIIEWTWNDVISPMFKLSELTLFKAWEMALLSSALFGGNKYNTTSK